MRISDWSSDVCSSDLGEHPSYAAVPIERPLFVVGLPRTGTTAIHRLLTADERHQGLELWLSEYPQPRPPRETWEQNPVFNGINAAYAQHPVANPEFMGIHYMDATTVEECWRRSEESRVGKECVSTGRSRRSPYK